MFELPITSLALFLCILLKCNTPCTRKSILYMFMADFSTYIIIKWSLVKMKCYLSHVYQVSENFWPPLYTLYLCCKACYVCRKGSGSAVGEGGSFSEGLIITPATRRISEINSIDSHDPLHAWSCLLSHQSSLFNMMHSILFSGWEIWKQLTSYLFMQL